MRRPAADAVPALCAMHSIRGLYAVCCTWRATCDSSTLARVGARQGETPVHPGSHHSPQQVLERVEATAMLNVRDDDCCDAVVDHIQAAPSGWLASMHGTLGPLRRWR
jgi:hypothetical protein